jgi:hypothetical protein
MLRTPFGVRPLAQEPLCINEPSTHTMTLLSCAFVGMAEPVKVTTMGEKVAVEGTHFFRSRALSFAIGAESDKTLLSLTDLVRQANVA